MYPFFQAVARAILPACSASLLLSLFPNPASSVRCSSSPTSSEKPSLMTLAEIQFSPICTPWALGWHSPWELGPSMFCLPFHTAATWKKQCGYTTSEALATGRTQEGAEGRYSTWEMHLRMLKPSARVIQDFMCLRVRRDYSQNRSLRTVTNDYGACTVCQALAKLFTTASHVIITIVLCGMYY